jgi:hypothetical protein
MKPAPLRDELDRIDGRLSELRGLRAQVDSMIAAAIRESEDVQSALTAETAAPETGAPVEIRSGGAADEFAKKDFSASQRLYLSAGKDLVAEVFGLQRSAPSSSARPAEDEFLPIATPTRVAQRAGVQAPSFYAQWPTDRGGRDAFVADLLVFMFSDEEMFTPARLQEQSPVDAVTEAIRAGRSPVSELHAFTSNNIRRHLLDDPLWYFQLYLASQVNRSDRAGDVVRQTLRLIYDSISSHYEPQYQRFLEDYHLKLREGVTLREVSRIITALAEGLAMRHKAEQTVPSTSTNMFGLGLFAVMMAFIVPEDGDAESFPQRAEAMFQDFAESGRRYGNETQK